MDFGGAQAGALIEALCDGHVELVPARPQFPEDGIGKHDDESVASGPTFFANIDQDALAEIAKLDGCFALKTDLRRDVADKHIVHNRYKDLALVEWAFRDCKTVNLEVRPKLIQPADNGYFLVCQDPP